MKLEIFYSFSAFIVMALFGAAITLSIASHNGLQGLGYFSIAYSFYSILSQIFGIGLHNSSLYFSGNSRTSSINDRRQLLLSLSMLSIFSSLGGTLIFLLIDQYLVYFADSKSVVSIRYAAYGIGLFCINKVWTSFCNGQGWIGYVSLTQILRYSAMLAGTIIILFLNEDAETISLIIPISELIVFAFLSTILAKKGLFRFVVPLKSSSIAHIRFGFRSFFGGLISELNSRSDIVVIGSILGPTATGAYAIASMIADGAFRFLVLFRAPFNSRMITPFSKGDLVPVVELMKFSRTRIFPAMVSISLISVLILLFLEGRLFLGIDFSSSLLPACILLFAFSICSPWIPFFQITTIAGHPSFFSLQYFSMFFANIITTVVLIPMVGVSGAAIGVLFGHLAGVVFLSFFAKNFLQWDIIWNKQI